MLARAVLTPSLLAAALALAPGLALASGDHGGGHEGPANPLIKQVALYPTPSGELATEPAGGRVPAGPATPGGESTPALWTAKATRGWTFDIGPYFELYVAVEKPTVVAGGPEGAAFLVQLAKNGEPIEGVANAQKVDGGVLLPGQEYRFKIFLRQPEVAFGPGDELGLMVSFFGLHSDAQPSVFYKLGGAEGTRLQFRIRMASLQDLDLPKEVGPWPVAPLEGFDFTAAAKKNPGAKVFTLKAYQFGFNGAPIVVPNGTKVILHLYVDESLSTSGEGHGGHHGATETGPAWDQNPVTPLHGFSLAALDPKLQTVLFDGLVVTMTFEANKPGNYTLLCTVVCGSGHGGMVDRLTIEGPAQPPGGDLEPTTVQLPDETAKTPGPPAWAVVAGVGALALLARRGARQG